MCYLTMCFHIILAEILREIDASQYIPYKRKSRWKIKLKKGVDDVVRKIINITGEQLYKITIHLPNYKTRHKDDHRGRIQTSTYNYSEKRNKKGKGSMRIRIIKIMKSRTTAALTLSHACATHINAQSRSTPIHTVFHPTSYDIYVDNCASRSITNNLIDFINKPVQADVRIHGTNGVSTGTLMGTVEWEIEDDNGRYSTQDTYP
jgi:hypothetical protein